MVEVASRDPCDLDLKCGLEVDGLSRKISSSDRAAYIVFSILVLFLGSQEICPDILEIVEDEWQLVIVSSN